MKNKLSPKQEELLTQIHALALDDSHREVAFSSDQLAMANRVIAKAEAKLKQIADLIQVICGD